MLHCFEPVANCHQLFLILTGFFLYAEVCEPVAICDWFTSFLYDFTFIQAFTNIA